MAERITTEELQNYLWQSAVLLRTNIDAGAYKQYIFPLLFFKRICDVYDEETQKAENEYGEDIELYPEEEIHTFLVPQGSHWNDVRQVAEDVGVAIVAAFRSIENANGERMIGIFGDGAWTNKNRLPDRLLKDLLEHFSSKTLSLENCPEDELGQGYEYLVKKFADDSGHTAQEFYTNRTVVHLMTEILGPHSGESVYDPTCGSSGMLISCIAHLKEQGKEWRNLQLYGQDINQLTCAIGRMNLFLHGIEEFHIVNDDTLKAPGFIENGRLKLFDLILANPPYSISQWDRGAFENDKYGRNCFGTPPQSRADYAFIQHIIASLKPDSGRAAILLPHGVLNRNEEKEIRKAIVKTDYIDAVIGLGRHLFYNSGLESCILVLRKNKPKEHKGSVLFIEAEKCTHKEHGQSYLFEEDIRKITEAYFGQKDIPNFSKRVTLDEIESNEGNLNIKLYVNSDEDISDGDFADNLDAFLSSSEETHTAFSNLQYLNGSAPYLGSTVEFGGFDKRGWKHVKLSDVAIEYSERIEDPSNSDYDWYIGSDCIDGFAYRISRKQAASKIHSAQKLFKKGDYLLVRRSLYGSDFRERAPRADFDGVCSADILTIREIPGAIVDGYLIAILYSKRLWDFIISNSTGSLTRRIKWKQLMDFEFDLPSEEEQKNLVNLLWAMERAKAAYSELVESANEYMDLQFNQLVDNSGCSNKLGDYIKRCTPRRCESRQLPVLSVTKERSIVFQNERFDTAVASKDKSNYIVAPRGYIIQGIHIDEGNFGLQNLCEEGIVSPAYKLWQITSNEIVPELLEYYLRSDRAIDYYRRNFQGTTVARRQTIKAEDLLNMPLNLPSYEKQKDFWEYMCQARDAKLSAQQALQDLSAAQKSLMRQYLG